MQLEVTESERIEKVTRKKNLHEGGKKELFLMDTEKGTKAVEIELQKMKTSDG